MQNNTFPVFSVLMSVYKKENPSFLDKALQSIENQTVKPYEIIVVEDGPLPSYLENILVDHQNKNSGVFKIIRKKRNGGLGESLQLGIKYVNTNWIARMDSDDIAVPNRFEIQLSMINESPNLAVVGGQVDEFLNDPTNIVGKREVPLDNKSIINFAKWRSPFNHPSVMIRKDAVLDVGGYGKQGKLEYYFLWVKLLSQNYDVANVPHVLVHMRTDTGMYDRRGDTANLKYIVKLHKFMYQNNIVNVFEATLGTLMMFTNIIIPSRVRKTIYQHVLRKR